MSQCAHPLQMVVHLEASQTGLHLYRHWHYPSHTNLWCAAPGPPIPHLWGEGKQQGAQGGVIGATRAQPWSKENSFTDAECGVVQLDHAAYFTHAPSHLLSSSVRCLFTHSPSHSITLRCLTCSLCNSTNKKYNTAISQDYPRCRRSNKMRPCWLEVPQFII